MRFLHHALSALSQYKNFQDAGRSRAEALRIEQVIRSQAVENAFDSGGLGTLKEARKAGMLDPRGVYLGLLDGKMLFFFPNQPLITYGPTGTGKGRDVIQPNLAHIRHSVVVTDPDGENAIVSGNHRETLGPVFYLNPQGLYGLPNTRFNPLDAVTRALARGDFQEAVNQGRNISHIFFPEPQNPGTNHWIRRDARELYLTVLMDQALSDPGRCNLSELYELFALPGQHLFGLVIERTNSEFVLKRIAKYAEQYRDSPKEAGWIRQEITGELELYERGTDFGNATEVSDIDPCQFKEIPCTAYQMVSGDTMETAASYLSLGVNYLIEGIARAEGPVRTTFLLDEFANLRAMPVTQKALKLYRKRGIQLWLFLQGRSALRLRYEEDGARDFEEQAGVIQYLRIDEDAVAQELERASGTKTVVVDSTATSRGPVQSGSFSASQQRVPNLWAADIRQLGGFQQILRIPGAPLFLAGRVPWWKVDPWSSQLRDLGSIVIPRRPGLTWEQAIQLFGLDVPYSLHEVEMRASLLVQRFDSELVLLARALLIEQASA